MQKLFAVELVFVFVLLALSDGAPLSKRKPTANGRALHFNGSGRQLVTKNFGCGTYWAESSWSLYYSFEGESLKCYVCRSDSDEGCGGTMNESLSQACPARSNASGVYCRKIHQKLRFKNEDSWTSIRECAYEKGHKNCYNFKWVDLAYQETCECEHDNCNRGSNRSPNILTITFALSMWMFSYLKTDHT